MTTNPAMMPPEAYGLVRSLRENKLRVRSIEMAGHEPALNFLVANGLAVIDGEKVAITAEGMSVKRVTRKAP